MPTFYNDQDDTYLVADAIIREEPLETAGVTKQPVDVGATITNHIQRMPQSFKVRAQWTDSPFANTRAAKEGAAGGMLDGAAKGRPVAAWEWFQAHRYEGTFTYDSLRWGFIPNLALESMSTVVTNKGELVVELTFTQILFAGAVIVDLPPRRIRPVPAKTEQSKGDQPGKIIDPSLAPASILDTLTTLAGFNAE
jgi:hypothetical protein